MRQSISLGFLVSFWFAVPALCALNSTEDTLFEDKLYYITYGITRGKILNIDTDITEMIDSKTRKYKKINSLLVHKIEYSSGRTVFLNPKLDSLERQVLAYQKKLHSYEKTDSLPPKPKLFCLGMIISQIHWVGLRAHLRPLAFLGIEATYGEDDDIDFEPIGNVSYPADFMLRRAASINLRTYFWKGRVQPSFFTGCVWLKTKKYSLLESSGKWEEEDARPSYLQLGFAFEYMMESRFAPGIQTSYLFKLGDHIEDKGFAPSLILSYFF
jgi:hypothetical protein